MKISTQEFQADFILFLSRLEVRIAVLNLKLQKHFWEKF